MKLMFGWAHMTRAEFDALLNYSGTVPTGIYLYKCWKRAKDYHNQTDDPGDWLLGRYEQSSKPGMVKICWYEINIVEDQSD